jgi:predicted DNA-binding transcriptional regulator AlpA
MHGVPPYAFPPRRMRIEAAAYYCGMSETAFRERVVAEVAPVRIGGTVGWMREDLDTWLDRQAQREAASNAYPDAKAAVLAHAQAILARRR